MMVGMSIVAVLVVILLVGVSAAAFREAPRDVRDVFCFLAMLAVGVVLVLVFVLKGF